MADFAIHGSKIARAACNTMRTFVNQKGYVNTPSVIPAKAGIHHRWIPAFAGMTTEKAQFHLNETRSNGPSRVVLRLFDLVYVAVQPASSIPQL
jgi:hypothetical protein